MKEPRRSDPAGLSRDRSPRDRFRVGGDKSYFGLAVRNGRILDEDPIENFAPPDPASRRSLPPPFRQIPALRYADRPAPRAQGRSHDIALRLAHPAGRESTLDPSRQRRSNLRVVRPTHDGTPRRGGELPLRGDPLSPRRNGIRVPHLHDQSRIVLQTMGRQRFRLALLHGWGTLGHVE